MTLPGEFIRNMAAQLGDGEARRLADALDGEPPVSVRFNPYKLTERPEGEQVPWSRYGYYLDERPRFTLDPLFHAGAYYVQETGSMFIEHLFSSVTGMKEGLRVLDLCAAPGGKTTLLSTLAGLDGLVVANEPIRQRAFTLADNVRKWGLGNVVVTNNDPAHFDAFRDYFDVVLVDAPCSGEGMFRKDPAAREQWSPANVELCARRQRRILADVWPALKPGGALIYSTCTFNETENEDNMAWLASEYDCEGVDIGVPAEWGVVKSTGGMFRFFPHRTRSEGFTAAVVRKTEGKVRTRSPKPRKAIFSELQKNDVRELSRWVNQPDFMRFARAGENLYGYYAAMFPDVRLLAETMTVIYSGVLMGQVFKGVLRPEHPLAVFHDLSEGVVPRTELTLEQALDYLRKNDTETGLFAEGMNLVGYEGFPLGWLKRIGGRVNNMYPKELRIVNL